MTDLCHRFPSARSLYDYELPRLAALSDNLFGASFFLMKLLPARVIMDQAEAAGELKPGGTIIETTSGTFGLALAMLSRLRGYRLILVSDPAIDQKLEHRLHELGAEVVIVKDPLPQGGYQLARLQRMNELFAVNHGAFWPSQYENKANPDSYALVADYLHHRLPRIDAVVGTVGSGGSMSGLTRALRRYFPNLTSIAVDTANSVIFGQHDGKRLLRGLGNSLMPRNVDHRQFDHVHWVGAVPAFAAARKLHRDHAIFMGGTSGAAYLVADWYTRSHPQHITVALFPDEGHRYIDTIYNDAYLAGLEDWSWDLPSAPKETNDPEMADPLWACMAWNRRTIDDLITRKKAVA